MGAKSPQSGEQASDRDSRSASTDEKKDGPQFKRGARVVLRDLSRREDLNGTVGEVIEWLTDQERYSVKCASGETVRVKPKNLADQASRAAIDPTLFVTAGGDFIQPRLPLSSAPSSTEREVMVAEEAETTACRMRVPAGHWEVQMVEVDENTVGVTLVGGQMLAATDEELNERDAAWNKLAGVTCRRSIQLDEPLSPDSHTQVGASVQDGTLTISLPRKSKESATPSLLEELPRKIGASNMGDKENRSPARMNTGKKRRTAPDEYSCASCEA